MCRSTNRVAILVAIFGYLLPASLWAGDIGHGGPVRDIDLQGDYLASAGFDYSVILWQSENLQPVSRHTRHSAPVSAVAINPQQLEIWSSDQSGLLVAWKPKSPDSYREIDQRSGAITDLRFSQDGKQVITAGWDGLVVIYDAISGKILRSAQAPKPLTSATWIEDRMTIVAADNSGNIHLWPVGEANGGHEVLEGDGLPISHFEYLPLEPILISVSSLGQLSLWSLSTKSRILTVDAHERPATALTVNGSGDIAATADAVGTIIIWRITNQQPERVIDLQSGPIWALRFDEARNHLLSGGADGTIRRWDMQNGAAVDLVGVPDQSMATVEDGHGAKLYNACRACHSTTPDDENKAGPTFYRLFGRKAGAVEDYPYSDTLAQSDLIWTEETLSALFRDGPENYVPGSRMPLQRMENPDDRAALIAHMKQLVGAAN